MRSEELAADRPAGLDDAVADRLIDLSVTLSERLPCTWPGHMPFAHKNWSWFADAALPSGASLRSLGPYQTNFLVIDEHCGTHFDAPTHFVPPPDSGLPWAGANGLQSGETVDLSKLVGPAAVVDARALAGCGRDGISPTIGPDLLQRWEETHGAFRPGEIVLFLTGWSRHYTEGEEGSRYVFEPFVTASAPGWPAPDAAAALYLHDRGVTTLGIDAPSIGSVHDGAPVHREGLSRGLVYVEMLTNLETLPSRGALFAFLPLKIAGSSGGPGRAIAVVGDGGRA